MLPKQYDVLIETERIRSVFQQAPLTLLVTVINTALTAYVLMPAVSPGLLAIWVGLIVVVSIARWVLRLRIRGQAPDSARCRLWAGLSVFGSLTTGVLWGFGAAVLAPVGDSYQLFFAFVVGGMCAGTTAVNSSHLATVLAFILPATLPMAMRFVAEGSPARVVAGLMVLVFAAALSLTSLRAHRAFGDRIRLQLALSRQSSELSNANQLLLNEIAERQKAEATLHQAQKMEAIGHLTGGIAHDFNNLLHVVTGNLSMIDRLATGNPRILGYVQAAEQAAKQGAHLTHSLLAFARRQSLQVKRVDLNILLREFHPILLRARGDSIVFRTFPAPDLPRCDIDPAHFQSALLNLVINARDAMPDGGELSISTGLATLGTAELRANPDATPGEFVSVSVQDTGSGMTEDVLAQVFEPFFTTKDVGKGSGLGLYQVNGFARQSGGLVHLRSAPGAGTCVTLYLPGADEPPN